MFPGLVLVPRGAQRPTAYKLTGNSVNVRTVAALMLTLLEGEGGGNGVTDGDGAVFVWVVGCGRRRRGGRHAAAM